MAERACPKCSEDMSLWTHSGVTLDHCGACKGLWFDANELTEHLANLDTESPESELVRDGPTGMACPACRDVRLASGTLLDIEVENCPTCGGIFLDLGELHELLGALNRPDRLGGKVVSGFDNFALGLWLGMHLGSKQE